MREGIRRTLAALVSVAGVLAIAALSRLSCGLEERERAVLRLSWRIIAERVEECRPLTAEEEAGTPKHMRPPAICEGRSAPYELSVWMDGDRVVHDTIHGAGAREDRPIYVFRELEVSPAVHRLEVELRPLLEAGEGESIEFEERLLVEPGGVVLLTYDAERGWVVRPAASRL